MQVERNPVLEVHPEEREEAGRMRGGTAEPQDVRHSLPIAVAVRDEVLVGVVDDRQEGPLLRLGQRSHGSLRHVRLPETPAAWRCHDSLGHVGPHSAPPWHSLFRTARRQLTRAGQPPVPKIRSGPTNSHGVQALACTESA